MHLFLHTCSEALSLNKTMKLNALPSNLSKMTVLETNDEVDITSTYQNNERFITSKEKCLNYASEALVIISQMTDVVPIDVDARANGTSLNHIKISFRWVCMPHPFYVTFKLICQKDAEII